MNPNEEYDELRVLPTRTPRQELRMRTLADRINADRRRSREGRPSIAQTVGVKINGNG